MILKAFAKLNLILKVIGKNIDNYHLLQMLNIKIDLYDEIHIEENKLNKDILLFNNSNLDGTKDNLIIKALDIYREYYNINKYYSIEVFKNIPIGAGLGGGSCDVGTILQYLSKEHNVNIFQQDFINKLAKIGADIPYSLYNNACIVEGIGEIIKPVSLDIKDDFIILYPNIHSKTVDIFKNNKLISNKIDMCYVINEINQSNYKLLENDLELSTFEIYPKLLEIKENTLKSSNKVVMSGSGSTLVIFSLDIDKTYNELKYQYPDFIIKKVKQIKE